MTAPAQQFGIGRGADWGKKPNASWTSTARVLARYGISLFEWSNHARSVASARMLIGRHTVRVLAGQYKTSDAYLSVHRFRHLDLPSIPIATEQSFGKVRNVDVLTCDVAVSK